MKTTTKESDRMAVVVQTDQGRLIVKTHKLDDDTTALRFNTVKRGAN
jgi:hypothetical protein